MLPTVANVSFSTIIKKESVGFYSTASRSRCFSGQKVQFQKKIAFPNLRLVKYYKSHGVMFCDGWAKKIFTNLSYYFAVMIKEYMLN